MKLYLFPNAIMCLRLEMFIWSTPYRGCATFCSSERHFWRTLSWVRHFLLFRAQCVSICAHRKLACQSFLRYLQWVRSLHQKFALFTVGALSVSTFYAIYHGCANCVTIQRYLQWVRSARQHFTLFTMGALIASKVYAIYNGCAQRVNNLRYLQWVR